MGKLIRINILIFLLLVPVAALASQYRVHNIGSLIGSYRSYTGAINNSGVVAFSAEYGYDQGDYEAAYVWHPDTGLNDISVAGRLEVVSDINDFGDVVGYGSLFPEALVLRRANGDIVDLSRLSGLERYSAGISAVNNSAQVVGTIDTHAVFWDSPDNPIDISGDNGLNNGAIDLNNNGQVLWSATWQTVEGTFIQPYIWTQAGGSTPLALSQEAQYAIACAINDEGIVVGRSGGPAKWLADGTLESLPTLGNINGSCAHGLNDNGQIVGELGFGAVLWDSDGSIIDLGSMIDGYQSCATGINENGWITGYMYSSDWSYCQAVVWQPVPEPSSIIALLCGMGSLAGLAVRRRVK